MSSTRKKTVKRPTCPYCSSNKMCPHSYVDNSEPGTEDNPANIQFSRTSIRVISEKKPIARK